MLFVRNMNFNSDTNKHHHCVHIYSRSHNDVVLNVFIENFVSEIATVVNGSCTIIEDKMCFFKTSK